MNQEFVEMAAKSAETDGKFLLKAKEEAKRRVLADSSRENVAAMVKAMEAVDDYLNKARAESAGDSSTEAVFKTQTAAVAFLKSRGFKVEKSKFHADFKAKLITKEASGFAEPALMAYAMARLEPADKLADDQMARKSLDRLGADAELKRITAARQQLKYDQELGNLVPRSDLVLNLSQRAQLLRSDMENLAYMLAGDIVAVAGGDEEKTEDVRVFLLARLLGFLDVYSQDREFALPEADDPAPAEQGELQ